MNFRSSLYILLRLVGRYVSILKMLEDITRVYRRRENIFLACRFFRKSTDWIISVRNLTLYRYEM